MPVPVLTRPPSPEITPANVVVASLPPVVSVCPAAICTPPVVPLPAREPMVSEFDTSSVAPATLAIVTAPVLAIALPLRTSSVPALMVVAPA